MRTGPWLTAWLALAASGSVSAQAPSLPLATPQSPAGPVMAPENIGIDSDVSRRLTVPVNVAGRGPYAFVVDTGAERTAISRELATELGLDPGRSATLISMTETRRIDTVVIPSLEVGARTISAIHAPAFARGNLGAEGLLGVDSLRDQRVEIDLERNEMQVTSAQRRTRSWPSDTIIVTGRRVFGQLVLVDAEFENERVWVIIDTGSQVSIGNSALRARLVRNHRLRSLLPLQLISVTGGVMNAEYGIARRIRIGGAEIRDLPVAFADARPFQYLRLTDRPAIMLGMDALRLFQRISIDFPNRRVRIVLRDTRSALDPVRMATRFPPPPRAEPGGEVSRSSDTGSSPP